MSGVADWAVGLVLALWLAVTVVAAVPSLRRRVTYWDVARLIPNWALFVRPRTEDLVLLRRDLLADGTLTGWIEVEIAGPSRWYNFLWHPELGPKRAFLALADHIARQARSGLLRRRVGKIGTSQLA
jgi:hypothetical protein